MARASIQSIARFSVAAAALVAIGGCSASKHYEEVRVGQRLSGSVIVEWMKPDRFLFTPKPGDPLQFVRSTGQTITPERMFTDGGSVPRPLWALKNFSPWGYGPAFIVHDWLYHMQDCEVPGWKDWTIEEAANVMSEVMKTMMEAPGFDYGNVSTVYLMYKAVQSAPAQAAWKDRNCEVIADTGDNWVPEGRIEVSFNSSSGL